MILDVVKRLEYYLLVRSEASSSLSITSAPRLHKGRGEEEEEDDGEKVSDSLCSD